MGARFLHSLSRIPLRVRREFRTRGGDARFLMWVAFLSGFVWAFVTTRLITQDKTIVSHEQVEVGNRVVIFGYHPHHIAFGVLLLAVAGWIGIHYAGTLVTRVAAVLYGFGLGFIVDEVAFIVDGVGAYRQSDVPEVLLLAVFVSALMMTTVYFPSFWASIEGRVKRLFVRHRRGRESHHAEPPPGPPGEARPGDVPAPPSDAERSHRPKP